MMIIVMIIPFAKHDNDYDYFWIKIIIVTMIYGNADDDQGCSHGNDWVWIIYDKSEDVSWFMSTILQR